MWYNLREYLRACHPTRNPSCDDALTRRPMEFPTAEQVEMNVRHRLARAFFAVEHKPVAVLQPELVGQLSGDQMHVPEQWPIFFGQVGVGRDDLITRDDEDVDRGLRIDVAKGEALIVFVNDVGLDLPIDNLLENVVRHHENDP